MNKEMVISSTPHETRVAILEDDQVVEIFIEREHSRGVVGNVYKGRVSKVLPGMQSAFVDLGLERDAFLYVSDVISPTEEALEDDEEPVAARAIEPPAEHAPVENASPVPLVAADADDLAISAAAEVMDPEPGPVATENEAGAVATDAPGADAGSRPNGKP